MFKETDYFPKLTPIEKLTGLILGGLALQFPEVARALKLRGHYTGAMSDVLLAFYSQCSLPKEETALIDRMALAIDIVLCNHNIEKERRQEILDRYRELCGICDMASSSTSES